MKKKLVLILVLGILVTSLSGCSEKTATATDQAELWQNVSDAYVYCLPLVLVNATKETMTNTVAPSHTRAPVNQLIHAKGLSILGDEKTVSSDSPSR